MVPFVMETHGAIHSEALSLANLLAHHAADNLQAFTTVSQFKLSLFQSLAIGLQLGNAHIMMTGLRWVKSQLPSRSSHARRQRHAPPQFVVSLS